MLLLIELLFFIYRSYIVSIYTYTWFYMLIGILPIFGIHLLVLTFYFCGIFSLCHLLSEMILLLFWFGCLSFLFLAELIYLHLLALRRGKTGVGILALFLVVEKIRQLFTAECVSCGLFIDGCGYVEVIFFSS